MDRSPLGSSVHGILPDQNTGVGSSFLLQGIFPAVATSQTTGIKPASSCLLHWQAGPLPPRHLGSPDVGWGKPMSETTRCPFAGSKELWYYSPLCLSPEKKLSKR